MATLTPAQIYALAQKAGLSPGAATIATAVALAESGGRTDAVGDVGLEDATWGPSVGLWQIRSVKAQSGTGQTRDATRLTDPAFNAASMASISGKGGSFNAWTTYKNGAYKKQLQNVVSGVFGAGTGVAGDAQSILNTLGLGGVASAATSAANAVGGALNWQQGASAVAMRVVAAVAAAGLVIVGALHTVSEK